MAEGLSTGLQSAKPIELMVDDRSDLWVMVRQTQGRVQRREGYLRVARRRKLALPIWKYRQAA
jgi:hypothetical protein